MQPFFIVEFLTNINPEVSEALLQGSSYNKGMHFATPVK